MSSKRFQLPVIRLNLATAFLEAAEAAGADVGGILAPLGLAASSFGDPDQFVPAPTMYNLVESLGTATGDPYIGAHVGEKLDLLTWSPMAEAVANGRTLGDLLLRFSIDAHRDANSVNFVLETRGNRCTFAECRVTDGGCLPRHKDAFGAALLLAILKAVTGEHWRGADVLVQVCDPAALPPGYLDVRVARGDTMGFRVAFPCDWLLLEPAAAQELYRPKLKSRSVHAAVPTDSLPALRHILDSHLHETGLESERVAELCGFSKRTLARRLSEHDTTLKAELDRLRAARAKTALLNEGLSVAQIGASVGYPDPSVFTRVFKRWTGMTPRKFREWGKLHAG